MWKLLDRRGDAVSEVAVPGPVPLDVDTWEDYEAVLAAGGGGVSDAVARGGPRRRDAAAKLDAVDYIADPGLATSLFFALRLPQPLLLEGEAGVGKTEAARRSPPRSAHG